MTVDMCQLDVAGKTLIKQGEAISRKLTLGHYENFTVATWFLPKRLKQDLFNIYAYCRIADDAVDETSGSAEASATLDQWESLLDAAACGAVTDPLFCAIGDTIQRRNLSLEPFRNLLSAFRLDLSKTRYDTWNDLREYTRLSADPVGRIVLELYDYHDPDFFALSDKICTALQLTNHWQDVAEDFFRGRIYIPREDMDIFGVSEQIFSKEQRTEHLTDAFQDLMHFEVERARKLFQQGKKLIGMVSASLRFQLALYWEGGMAALDAIERIDFNVLSESARLKRTDKMKVAVKALGQVLFR